MNYYGKVIYLMLSIWLNTLCISSLEVHDENESSVLEIKAYDCAEGKTNTTAISLATVKACKIEPEKMTTTNATVQIVMKSKTLPVRINLCKVTSVRTLFKCGFAGDAQPAPYGHDFVKYQPSKIECDRMISQNSFIYQGSEINNLRLGTNKITRLGSGVTGEGSCSGNAYTAVNGKTYADVYYYEYLEIILDSYTKYYDAASNMVDLENIGALTILDKEGMVDTLSHGTISWTKTKISSCRDDNMKILYEGAASKVTLSNDRVVWVVDTDTRAFVLEESAKMYLCRMYVSLLGDSDLFIINLDDKRNRGGLSGQSGSILDIDPSYNMLSRMLFLETHIGKSLRELATYLETNLCDIRRQNLERLLTDSDHSPMQFAYYVTNKHGYVSDVRGSVVYLSKCKEVDVRIRASGRCYQDMPISYNNQSYYMDIHTRTILSHSVELPCNQMVPVIYAVDGLWISTWPSLKQVKENPTELDPNNPNAWKYKDPGTSLRDGIYTKKDLTEYRKYIMNRMVERSIDQSLARSLSGTPIDTAGLDTTSLINTSIIRGFFPTFLYWGYDIFMKVGIWSSSILGFYFAWKMLCAFVDKCLNWYSLYKQFGCSYRLLTCVSDTLTRIQLTSGDYSLGMSRIREWSRKRFRKAPQPDIEAPEEQPMSTVRHNNEQPGYMYYPNLPKHAYNQTMP